MAIFLRSLSTKASVSNHLTAIELLTICSCLNAAHTAGPIIGRRRLRRFLLSLPLPGVLVVGRGNGAAFPVAVIIGAEPPTPALPSCGRWWWCWAVIAGLISMRAFMAREKPSASDIH